MRATIFQSLRRSSHEYNEEAGRRNTSLISGLVHSLGASVVTPPVVSLAKWVEDMELSEIKLGGKPKKEISHTEKMQALKLIKKIARKFRLKFIWMPKHFLVISPKEFSEVSVLYEEKDKIIRHSHKSTSIFMGLGGPKGNYYLTESFPKPSEHNEELAKNQEDTKPDFLIISVKVPANFPKKTSLGELVQKGSEMRVLQRIPGELYKQVEQMIAQEDRQNNELDKKFEEYNKKPRTEHYIH